jgi:hypothetical protein
MKRRSNLSIMAMLLFILVSPTAFSQPPVREGLSTTSSVCEELRNYLDCTSAKSVDIVFVFDTTGSMGEEISEMVAISKEFADNLAISGIDYQLGLTEFKDFPVTCDGNTCGDPTDFAYKVYGLTGDAATFKSWIESLSASGGNDEPESSLAAMRHTVTDQSWRSGGVSKIAILITDAEPHLDGDCCNQEGDTLESVMSILTDNGVKVYVVGPDVDSFRMMAFDTGGKFYEMGSVRSGEVTLRPILDDITGAISCTFEIVGDAICDGGDLTVCVKLQGRDGIPIPNRPDYTNVWMYVGCPDGSSERYDLEYDAATAYYCATVDPACEGESGVVEVTVYGSVCDWGSVKKFMVDCGGGVCPPPCLAVEITVDEDSYTYGDSVEYYVSVTSNQYEMGRIAISYGYIDPTPFTHVIGTRMPDIDPKDTYDFFGDFKVLDGFYSGGYIFFATATDIYNPECSVSDAVVFWVE